MTALMQEYRQCVTDAQNLIDLLINSNRFSDDVKVSCRYALYWYIHTCTPEESVPEFQREIAAVTEIMMMELGE